MTAHPMRARDIPSMDLTDIRAEIELIQTEARRMAPSEAEFLRRFPTMAARLKSLMEQRDRLQGGAPSTRPSSPAEATPAKPPPPPPRAPRVVGPARRPTSFLDLREELLDADAPRPPGGDAGAETGPRPGDDRFKKELAARDAEIGRLREERDDWRGKAEGAESRLTRGAEIARRLEETLAEVDALRARIADLESVAAHSTENADAAADLRQEVDQLRNQQEAMNAAHDQELERLRERHRQEIESWMERENERARLEARAASAESELTEARADAQRAHQTLEGEIARLRDDLETARADGASTAAEFDRLTRQLEAATLDRNVVCVGILQAIERVAARIEGDPRYAALPESDPVLSELRRELFQSLERFADDVRAIGTDIGAEAFLHAIAERLDAIPEWTGRLLESIARVTESSRAVLSARDEDLLDELAAREAAQARVTALEGRVRELEAALDQGTRTAREQAESTAAELDAARAQSAALGADLAAARLGLADLEAAHRAALEAHADLDARARRDASEVQRLEDALDLSELRKAEVESELTALRAAHASAQTRVASLETDLTQAQQRATSADRESLDLGNSLAEARGKLGALEQTIERVLRDLAAALPAR